MLIRKIEIDHFGKLNNFKLDFSDGLNFIYGRNEDGKSTVMAFVRMMFYGNVGVSRELSVNARKRYRPWNGAQMGGAIEFETNGKNYRLQKVFGQTAGKDEVCLLNLDTGTPEPLSSDEEVGTHFFGMELAGFERSVFIGRSGGFSGNDGKNDGITEKLINLTTSADEKLSLSGALASLNGAKEKLVSKRKNAGLLVEAREKVGELEEELREARRLEAAQREIREQHDTLVKLQIAEKDRLDVVKQRRRLLHDAEEELILGRELQSKAESRLDSFIVEKDKHAEIAEIKLNAVRERLEQAKDAATKENIKGLMPLFAVLLVLAVVTTVFCALKFSPWFWFLGLTVPVAVLAECSAISRKNRMERYRKSAADRVAKLEEELEEILETTGREAATDEKLLGRIRTEAQESAKTVKRREMRVAEMKKQLAADDGLEEEILKREEQISALRSECHEPDRTIGAISEEMEEAREKLAEYEEYYAALNLSVSVMEEASEELRKNFGPRLNERTAEIFNGLTGGHYRNVSVSKDFGIKVLENDDVFYREGGYLSNGTVDQAYFALRLAIVELLSDADGERFPLLLDDIFEQYDDDRTTDGLNFLRDYSDRRGGQVILFTCHRHVLEKARVAAPYANFPVLTKLSHGEASV